MIDHATMPVRTRLMDLAREHGCLCYDPATQRCLIARDTLWWAIALAHSEDAADLALADELFRTVPSEDSTHTPATMLAVLLCMRDRISDDAAAHLEHEVRCMQPQSALAEWHDGNVNHPAAGWCALILGGERSGDDLAVRLGAEKLHALRRTAGGRHHVFHTQSALSEYNSPTYTALTLWWLALTAEFARDADARDVALFLEQQLWLDVALHWHAPSQQLGGPYSRAYLDDSLGGWSAVHCTLAAATGRDILLDPSVAISARHPSSIIENALVAILPYHIPREAADAAFAKSLPCLVRQATYGEAYHENNAAAGFDDRVYPGGWSDLVTWHTREFTLGTASRPYVNAGHSDACVVRIRRAENIASRRDVRAMFCRGVFDDADVQHANACRTTGGSTDESYLYEEGRTAILQHRGKAVVQYTPKGTHDRLCTAFRVDIVFSHDAPFDRLLIDGRDVPSLPAHADAHARIAFRDFRTFGAIVPLALDPSAADALVTLREHDGCLVISLWNHHGGETDASCGRMHTWRNGFFIELAEADAHADFDAFLANVARIRVDDTLDASGVRSTRAACGDDVLVLENDPRAEHILTATVNGADARVRHFTSDHPVPPLYGDDAWRAFLAREGRG